MSSAQIPSSVVNFFISGICSCIFKSEACDKANVTFVVMKKKKSSTISNLGEKVAPNKIKHTLIKKKKENTSVTEQMFAYTFSRA